MIKDLELTPLEIFFEKAELLYDGDDYVVLED
jgi:hypothetical protein